MTSSIRFPLLPRLYKLRCVCLWFVSFSAVLCSLWFVPFCVVLCSSVACIRLCCSVFVCGLYPSVLFCVRLWPVSVGVVLCSSVAVSVGVVLCSSVACVRLCCSVFFCGLCPSVLFCVLLWPVSVGVVLCSSVARVRLWPFLGVLLWLTPTPAPAAARTRGNPPGNAARMPRAVRQRAPDCRTQRSGRHGALAGCA
jgi:hypothetical protein